MRGKIGLTLFAGLWLTVVWIGSDMYLPALPALDEYFHTDDSVVTITLLVYNLFLPIGALIGGSVSDKFGRRAPTLGGALLLIGGSVVCALSFDIWMLIVFRTIAGFGGGVITATSMAILRDVLEGKELENSLTITQSLAIIGPIAAPFLGSFMLMVFNWHAIFVLLALLSFACLLWYLSIGETLPREKRVNLGVMRSVGLVLKVARDRAFLMLLIVLVLAMTVFGVFMTVCSYIYIDFFALSSLQYSFCYGFNCAIEIFAPFLYMAMRKRLSNKRIIWATIFLLALSGICIMAFGWMSPIFFLLGCVPFTLAEGIDRPCLYVVLLAGREENAGSASALIGFGIGLAAALGTPLASLGIWGGNDIVAMGASALGVAIVSGVLFFILLGPMRSKILDEETPVSES